MQLYGVVRRKIINLYGAVRHSPEYGLKSRETLYGVVRQKFTKKINYGLSMLIKLVIPVDKMP